MIIVVKQKTAYEVTLLF